MVEIKRLIPHIMAQCLGKRLFAQVPSLCFFYPLEGGQRLIGAGWFRLSVDNECVSYDQISVARMQKWWVWQGRGARYGPASW